MKLFWHFSLLVILGGQEEILSNKVVKYWITEKLKPLVVIKPHFNLALNWLIDVRLMSKCLDQPRLAFKIVADDLLYFVDL